MTDAVDISDFIPADTIRHEILKPGTDIGTGWFFDLAGPGHDKAVAWSTSRQRSALDRQARLEAQQANGRKIKPEDRDVDEVRRENVGWVTSRVLGFTPVKLPWRDEPVVYSEASALELLMDPRLGFALGQLVDILTDDAAFMKRSAKA